MKKNDELILRKKTLQMDSQTGQTDGRTGISQ